MLESTQLSLEGGRVPQRERWLSWDRKDTRTGPGTGPEVASRICVGETRCPSLLLLTGQVWASADPSGSRDPCGALPHGEVACRCGETVGAGGSQESWAWGQTGLLPSPASLDLSFPVCQVWWWQPSGLLDGMTLCVKFLSRGPCLCRVASHCHGCHWCRCHRWEALCLQCTVPEGSGLWEVCRGGSGPGESDMILP